MRLKYIFPMCKIDLCMNRSFHLCQKKSSKYSQHLYSNLNFINHFYISFHHGVKQILSAVLGSVQYEVSGINQTVICIRQQALPILVFCLTVYKAFGRGSGLGKLFSLGTPLHSGLGKRLRPIYLEKESDPGAFGTQFTQTSGMFPYPTLVQAPSLGDIQYRSFLWIFFQLPDQGFLFSYKSSRGKAW